jgi:hypothetical protein
MEMASIITIAMAFICFYFTLHILSIWTDKNGDWEYRAICPCGYRWRVPHNSVYHIQDWICPKCGARGSKAVRTICRWVSTSIWFLPWTWGRGHWEDK